METGSPTSSSPSPDPGTGIVSPTGTMPVTWATTVVAAVAMTGPTVRAVLRWTRSPMASARCAGIRATSA